MNEKTKKIAMASMFTAIICIATMIIQIPLPSKGYINIGDCPVILSGWILSPFYGFLSSGIGSALADIFSGYVLYAPATFVIKGLMSVCAYFLFKFLNSKTGSFAAYLISGAAAEIVMSAGYLIFEGFLYGFQVAFLNVYGGLIQGSAGLVLAILFIKALKRQKENN